MTTHQRTLFKLVTISAFLLVPNVSSAQPCVGGAPNGAITGNEECDDDNAVNGDGCSTMCAVEDGYACAVTSFSGITPDVGNGAVWTDITASSARQTQNTTLPSVSLFGADATATTYTFDVRVNDQSDDDFIGFVLGYTGNEWRTDDADFLLLDWKKANQVLGGDARVARRGLALSRVEGDLGVLSAPAYPDRDFWYHAGVVSELARGANLGDTGWTQQTTHRFVITYSATRLIVTVDGVLELDVTVAAGTFPLGEIGFYGLSQEDVRYTLIGPFSSVCAGICGDGLVVGAEVCDDDNVTAGDGCSATCTPETGYECEGAPSECMAVCGDGAIVADEVCDDANTSNADGCSASCRPEVVITTPTGTPVIVGSPITVAGTADAGATIAIMVDGIEVGSVMADATGNYTFVIPGTAFPTFDETAPVISVSATDTLGHVSTDMVAVSLVGIALTSPLDGSSTGDTTPPVSGITVPNVSVSITIDGGIGSIGPVMSDANGLFSLDAPTLPDGTYTVTATYFDVVTNMTVTDTTTFTVNTLVPVVTIDGPTGTTTDTTPTVTGTTEPGLTVTISVDGVVIGTAIADANGNWSFDTGTALTEGVHTITAEVTRGGLTGTASGSFVVDTAEPVAAGGGVSGGAFCALGTTSNTSAWLALVLAGLVLARRRQRTRSATKGTLLAVAFVSMLPSLGHAQSTTLNAFTPSQTSRDGFATSTAEDQGHMRFGAQLYLDYANDPLVYEDRAGSPGSESQQIVRHHLAGHLGLSLGLADRVVLFAGLPVNLVMRGNAEGLPIPDADGLGLGDAYVGGRVRLFGTTDDVFMLAAQATLSLPLAGLANGDQAYSGDATVTFHPQLIAQINAGRLRLVANVGMRIRENQTFLNVVVGDQLTYGVGALIEVVDELDAVIELHGASTVQQFFHRDETPLALLVGGKYRHDSGLVVGLGAGPGLVRGFGSPDIRVLATLGYTRPAQARVEGADTDADGIPDASDACPTEPEDRDGFEDENGCPDTDNDADGILDSADACPNEAEDVDGFEDENGCPDPDNDADGVIDTADACPNAAEDVDGFEDENGCPDPDNDADGVLDVADRCPVEAGVASAQGCPEPDRDADTVIDRSDNCPDVPGTVANHGCAEQQLVQIEGDTIAIVENVYFRTNRDVIEARSFPLLDNVAAVVNAHPEITRVRIEGHTDARGNRARNVRLSQARADAVLRYLVAHGVAEGRLVATGYGPDRPVMPSAQTPEEHARNRRVEFHIEGADIATGRGTTETDR